MQEFPNVSFGHPFIAPEGYALVERTTSPDHDPIYKHIKESKPVLVADLWTQQWELLDNDEETVQKLLAKTKKIEDIAKAKDELKAIDEDGKALSLAKLDSQLKAIRKILGV